MKIEKNDFGNWFYYSYNNSKTDNLIYHGLYNSWYDSRIGYYYHGHDKGFCLRYKRWL